jgi:hypothetical protein
MSPEHDPDSLGNLLLTAGVITLQDLRDALDHADAVSLERRRKRSSAPLMRLGEALIDLGRVDQPLIDTVLAHQGANRTSGSVAKAKHLCAGLASARAAKQAEIEALDELQRAAVRVIRRGQA